MALSMTAEGLTALTVSEAAIDGIYDDPSGYATFGVGHLIHKPDMWGSFLLAAAQANDTWKGKVLTNDVTKTTYLPRTVVGWPDWADVQTKAVELGTATVGKKKYGKDADKLSEAEKTTAKGIAEAGVRIEVDLIAKTVTDVFSADLVSYELGVNTTITGVTLTQEEYHALVSLTFNIGVDAFAGSTVAKKINENKYRDGDDVKARETAITQIENGFAAWNKSGGVVSPGLVKRRKEESDRFLKGARDEVTAMKLKAATASPKK